MTLDEAIKHAEEVAEEQERSAGFFYDKESANYKKKCIKSENRQLAEWLKELKQLREQTRWIPVSEKLPDDEDYVLVCYEDGHIRTAYYYIDTNIYPSEFEDCCETGWYNYNEDFMYKQDVVAWMPLPEPYKAEIINRNLCDSCTNYGCILQSGIVRNHCDFYITESEK